MELMEEAMKATASVNMNDVVHDYRPRLVVYKDGRVQRFLGIQRVPASMDAGTGVESQDVVIRPEEEGWAWVRLYKPAGVDGRRLPVVVYFHGGAFIVESTASPEYHNYLNAFTMKTNVLVVSVEYRLAPEHPLPAAYEDSWAALDWVKGEHEKEHGHPWIKDYADLSRVFVAGDSAGANIAHHMAKRLGKAKELGELKLKGVLLIHPFFWGKDRIGSELQKMNNTPGGGMGQMAEKLWALVCPGTSGTDDLFLNPGMDSELSALAGEKVMVCVAEKDIFRDRGVHYKEVLLESGCKANVEVMETLGEDHVFHLFNPTSPNVGPFMYEVATFLNSC